MISCFNGAYDCVGVLVSMVGVEADVNPTSPNVKLQLWQVLQNTEIHIPVLQEPKIGGFDLMAL